MTSKFKPRVREPNEALPPQSRDWATRPAYRTGDGEVLIARRPGSEEHLRFKSRGLGV